MRLTKKARMISRTVAIARMKHNLIVVFYGDLDGNTETFLLKSKSRIGCERLTGEDETKLFKDSGITVD